MKTSFMYNKKKRLKIKLASLTLDYIKKYSGKDNREQRTAKYEIDLIKSVIDAIN